MSSNAIIAKARCIHGKMLTENEYATLLQRRTVGDAVAYLAGTEHYKAFMHGVDVTDMHRGQFEELMQKYSFENYIRLKKFSGMGRNAFASFQVKKLELQQVLKALVFIREHSPESIIVSIPMYLQGYTDFNLLTLATATTEDELLRVIEETSYYSVLKKAFAENSSTNRCTAILNAYYIRWAFKAINANFKGSEAAELKNLFLLDADLTNIMLCYRLNKYFGAGIDAITEVMTPYHYRFNAATIDDVLGRPNADEELVKLLESRYFKKGQADRENLETEIQRYKYRQAKKCLALSTNGMAVLYLLVTLFDIERTNLQKTIEGIRYNVPPSEIEKILVL